MCLYIKKTDKILTAVEDMICYKAICSEISNETISYYTPYQRTNISINTTYKSLLRRVRTKKTNHCDIVYLGLHSFKTIGAAKYIASWFNDRYDFQNTYVVKCVIPKGTKYYVGEFVERISYASEFLKYERLVKVKN